MSNKFTTDRYKLNLFRQPSVVCSINVSAKEITDEVFEADQLYISILPIDLPDSTRSYRKNLESQWLELLPKLNKVKSLTVRLKASQPFFETICQMQNLECLSVVTSTATDINALCKLRKLTRLHLTSFSQLKDISVLPQLDKLEILTIGNSFNIENYEIIGQMKQLIALGIFGDESSPKNLRLKSLQPFRFLKNLRHLDLSLTTVIDKSYEILLEMESLERLDIHAKMNKTLRDQIKSHPQLKAGFFIDWDWENNCFYPGKTW